MKVIARLCLLLLRGRRDRGMQTGCPRCKCWVLFAARGRKKTGMNFESLNFLPLKKKQDQWQGTKCYRGTGLSKASLSDDNLCTSTSKARPKHNGAGCTVQLVEHLTSMQNALGWILSTTKTGRTTYSRTREVKAGESRVQGHLSLHCDLSRLRYKLAFGSWACTWAAEAPACVAQASLTWLRAHRSLWSCLKWAALASFTCSLSSSCPHVCCNGGRETSLCLSCLTIPHCQNRLCPQIRWDGVNTRKGIFF